MPGQQWVGNCHEGDLKAPPSSHWRASLVPAAAVIPAPIVYIKIVAVKKLVVGNPYKV